MFCALLCACLLPGLLSATASADPAGSEIAGGSFGDSVQWHLYDDGELVFSGSGKMTEMKSQAGIPWAGYRDQILRATVESGITSIGRTAFYGCSRLSSVSIPASVTEIGAYAFSGCASLSEITIPDAVQEIGYNAFENCSSLRSVVLPAGLESLYDNTFHNCTSLTSVILPASIESFGYSSGAFIGCPGLTSAGPAGGDYSIQFGWTKEIPNYAFLNCSTLQNVSLPSGLTRIGKRAFSGCAALAAADIPEGVAEIGERAFSECAALAAVKVPASVTVMGEDIFAACGGLTDAGPAGSGSRYQFGWTESIPDYAFAGCSGLETVTLPDGVTTVGAGAFSGCAALKDVKLGAKLNKLGAKAFSNCESLARITFPASLREIGGSAFSGCTALADVYISDLNAWCAISYGGNPQFPGHRLVLNGSEVTELVFPSGSTEIGNHCFSGCVSLTKVTVPYGVTVIGDRAFAQCASLREITIPRGLKEIRTAAFVACPELKDIYYRGTEDQFNQDSILVYQDNLSLQSATVHCIPEAVEAPRLTGKNNSKGYPALSCDAVESATKYQFFRATSKNGSYKLVKETRSPKFTDTGAEFGKTYFYKVKAVTAEGGESPDSEVISLARKPVAPKVTGKLNSKGKPVLTWKAVDGAVKYQIYYAASKNGKYQLLKTTKALKYTHTGAKAGKTCYYKICAVTKKGVKSAYSTVVKIKAKSIRHAKSGKQTGIHAFL